MEPTQGAPVAAQPATRGRHELRATRLRALLRERKVTQTALAARMGMTRGHVNDVLRGRAGLGRPFMDALRSTFPDEYDELVVWVVDTETVENAS